MQLLQQYASCPYKQAQIALRDHSQGVAFSWQELNQLVSEKQDWLLSLGLQPGSGVAFSGKNSFELLCCYLAGLQGKMRVLGINPAFTTEKIEQLCQQNQIQRWIDVGENLCVRPLKTELDFRIGTNSPSNDKAKGLTLTLTSGSTGTPKAIVHDIQAHLDNAQGVCQLMDFTAEKSWLLSLPLYHVSGQGIVWRWILQGAELHLPSCHFYQDVLQVSHVSLVPTQALRLFEYVAKNPQTALQTREILLGGASIPLEISQKLTALGIKAYAGYGMTEMASTVFAKRCDGETGVGQPLLGRVFQIVNDEIWLKGAGLALGYWQNGEIQPLTNPQGWLQTKDKAYWDGEQLHILGRLDNQFISGGENIQPEEIEQIIQQHPLVEQVFVLPIDDAEFGQRPVAMMKFQQEFSQTAVQKIQDFLINKIERFKQPVRYFPLNLEWQGNIKISRVNLKQVLAQLIGE
ncbi:o-succinylbenzoate--CoA ligase [Lonepinella koalarum]|uniref:2-succinylbenzoyl-CoA synthetase n=1 Tax=Lonepinella koalarum TaxID=53417 RepID=A0A4R1KVM1_9PAST|nr:o-succinylbenzoate--CoA ligase [Lonepinella koalarum]MDH2927469.1 2-succinylbenzoate-CoA ligase [Lonepinella koalarum]TCK68389.1 2-succinylbenzoyl-CoA synthetase [Lonepinella koalarum]TFJ89643.1 o-succinylbenzoate--CoA ligase [Lonepinella koalarum]